MLVAPPGSGKTTRVPPAILRSGLLSAEHPVVIVLQPRRVAARASAARIAEEQGWRLGEEVGYQVRFERRLTRKTRLRFLTEGILTRQLLADPFLETVGAVILDEFHERNLNGDLALALLRQVRQEVRPDLILVVMSATLDAQPVSHFLDGCPIVRVEGRAHRSGGAIPAGRAGRPALRRSFRSSRSGCPIQHDSGHLLVFLPGFAEIRRVAKRLEPAAARAGALVLPLHGSLTAEDQDRALRAERSPQGHSEHERGRDVVDDRRGDHGDRQRTGAARALRWRNAASTAGSWAGSVAPPPTSARVGQAGRGRARASASGPNATTAAGPNSSSPRSTESTSSSTVLALHAWGVSDPVRFDWYDPPRPERLAERRTAARCLLGGLAGDPPRITPLG